MNLNVIFSLFNTEAEIAIFPGPSLPTPCFTYRLQAGL